MQSPSIRASAIFLSFFNHTSPFNTAQELPCTLFGQAQCRFWDTFAMTKIQRRARCEGLLLQCVAAPEDFKKRVWGFGPTKLHVALAWTWWRQTHPNPRHVPYTVFVNIVCISAHKAMWSLLHIRQPHRVAGHLLEPTKLFSIRPNFMQFQFLHAY